MGGQVWIEINTFDQVALKLVFCDSSDESLSITVFTNTMNTQTFAVQVKFPVHAGISSDDLAEVERVVPDLVSLVLERRALRSAADRDSMAEFLLKDIAT